MSLNGSGTGSNRPVVKKSVCFVVEIGVAGFCACPFAATEGSEGYFIGFRPGRTPDVNRWSNRRKVSL